MTLYLLASLHVYLVERRPQASRQLLGIIVGPEVHEEEMRRIGQHVAVKRGHFDAVISQRFDHRIDLAGDENEVAGDGSLSSTSRLKVDCLSGTHCRRNHNPVAAHGYIGNLLSSRNAVLKNDPISLSHLSHDLIDLLGINANIGILGRRCGCGEWRLTKRKRVMN